MELLVYSSCELHPSHNAAEIRQHYIRMAEFGLLPKYKQLHTAKRREHLDRLQREVVNPSAGSGSSLLTSASGAALQSLSQTCPVTRRFFFRSSQLGCAPS